MFGDYDIIETLGEGGMGIVYRAHDVTLDRIVAVKVLKDDLLSLPHLVARFQREAEAYARLNHPNIVHIYSVGAVGDTPYIAMELVDGRTVGQEMRREGRIEWKRALRIGQQVAEALACAHEARVIHRDIKPGNILLDAHDHAYVTDFGIAKVLTAETQLTVDSSRLGTPEYMSPERCQNKAISMTSDIYSLGVLLFQMMSGRLPYEAPTPVSLVRKIVAEPPARLRSYVEDVPENVEHLVAYMIEKDPKNRPASAGELATLIERVRDGKPLVDDDSGIGSALEDFRDYISTPTPSSALSDSATTPTEHYKSFMARVRGLWAHLPGEARMVILAILLIAGAGAVGWRVADRLNQGFAFETVRHMETKVTPWQDSASVADFEDESPGILRAPVNLQAFELDAAGWTSGGTAVVLLKGKNGSPRQGQSAICVIEPGPRTALLRVPPVRGASGLPGLASLAFVRGQASGGFLRGHFVFRADVSLGSGQTEPGVMASKPGFGGGLPWTVFRVSDWTRNPELAGLRPRAIGPLTVSPDGETLAIALSENGDAPSWVLAERKANIGSEGPAYTVLTQPGLPIAAVEYTPDGTKIVYMREGAEGQRELWVVESGGAETDGRKLAEGRFTLGRGAIGPRGGTLVLAESLTAESMPTGDGELRLIDLGSGTVTKELGRGAMAVWHPSGGYVVAVAKDRKGNAQLWAASTEEPGKRLQLTHIDGGTLLECTVSTDGKWAVSGVGHADLPTLIFADLSKLVHF